VCLEPKKKPSLFSFSLVPHSALLYLSFLIQKTHTHAAFILELAASQTSISKRIEAAFRALQDKPFMGFIIVCGLAPKGAVHLTSTIDRGSSHRFHYPGFSTSKVLLFFPRIP
jgi:hypothetical protein